MQVITRVTMTTSAGNKVMQLGSRGITKIVDAGHEEPDGRIHFIFQGLDEGNNLVAEFINGAFAVEYKKVNIDKNDN